MYTACDIIYRVAVISLIKWVWLHLPQLAQTHVHQIGDATQQFFLLSSPLPPAFNFLRIRVFSNESVLTIRWSKGTLFMDSRFSSNWIGGSASALALPKNIQDWFPLGWTGWISLQFKGFSRVLPNTTVQKHQFFGTQLSLWSNSDTHRDFWKNP